jgi:hypothetical protein
MSAQTKNAFIVRDLKKVEKNTLRAFLTLETASGLVFREVSLHEKEGKRWISMPAKPFTKNDSTTGYKPMIEFRDAATRHAFQSQALEAIDAMLAELAEVSQ